MEFLLQAIQFQSYQKADKIQESQILWKTTGTNQTGKPTNSIQIVRRKTSQEAEQYQKANKNIQKIFSYSSCLFSPKNISIWIYFCLFIIVKNCITAASFSNVIINFKLQLVKFIFVWMSNCNFPRTDEKPCYLATEVMK